MQKINPCLWFDHQAEEAAGFYTSVFPDSKILEVTRYGRAEAESAGRPAGSVLTVAFRIFGQEFMALNGGPRFPFSPAVSFLVNCETQEEVDRLWESLSEGGEEDRCGWLKDRFGLSWQVVPRALGALVNDPDPARSQRVMKAMLGMKKIDLDALKKAAEAK